MTRRTNDVEIVIIFGEMGKWELQALVSSDSKIRFFLKLRHLYILHHFFRWRRNRFMGVYLLRVSVPLFGCHFYFFKKKELYRHFCINLRSSRVYSRHMSIYINSLSQLVDQYHRCLHIKSSAPTLYSFSALFIYAVTVYTYKSC